MGAENVIPSSGQGRSISRLIGPPPPHERPSSSSAKSAAIEDSGRLAGEGWRPIAGGAPHLFEFFGPGVVDPHSLRVMLKGSAAALVDILNVGSPPLEGWHHAEEVPRGVQA